MKQFDLRLILTATCAEASRLASESLDRELSSSERWALRLHAAVCGNCRRFLRQLHTIRSVLAKMTTPWRKEWHQQLVRLSPEKRREIKRLLADAGAADGP